MSVAARAVALFVAFFVVIGLGVFVALYYIGGTSALPTVHYAASGGQANVVLQEDPQNNSASKPDWVSYYVQDPANSQWIPADRHRSAPRRPRSGTSCRGRTTVADIEQPVSARDRIALQQPDCHERGDVAVRGAQAHAELARDIGVGEIAPILRERREQQQPLYQRPRQAPIDVQRWIGLDSPAHV